MNHVIAKDQRNVQPRLFHGDVLVGICFFRAYRVEQRANLPLGDTFFVVGAASARAGRSARRILHQLAYLLLQRHLLQQFFHPLVQLGIGQLRVRHCGGNDGSLLGGGFFCLGGSTLKSDACGKQCAGDQEQTRVFE